VGVVSGGVFWGGGGGGGGEGNVGMMQSSGSIELHHFRASPLCEWDLRSSRMLSSVD